MKSFNDITRRDFFKTVGKVVLAAGTLSLELPTISLAAQSEPVTYPKLPGNKIQPPENGCLVGVYKPYVTNQTAMRDFASVSQKAKDYDEMKKLQEPLRKKYDTEFLQNIKNNIGNYASALGTKPFAYVLAEQPKLYLDFPDIQCETVSKEGIVPYVSAFTNSFNQRFNLNLEDIAKGKHDKYISNFAKGAAQVGEKNGSFFFTTMIESNANWWYWGRISDIVPAWKHIWQVFEDQGANQYATWVWEAYCPEGMPQNTSDPERFYPGDHHVDWIGLSAFAWRQNRTSDMPFTDLVSRTYERLHKLSPQKPLMQAEFGKTNASDQPSWLTKAYTSIKTEFPAIKAAIQWDNISPNGDDHTLSTKSLQAMKEIFKDPYWIMAK